MIPGPDAAAAGGRVRPVVCMITDRRALGAGARTTAEEALADALVRQVAAAARAGVDLVQLRERDLDGGPLHRLAARCMDAVAGTRARILLNDRLDVALAAGAHGVHLRGDSMPAARVRAVAPVGFLVGRSVHDAGEAARVAGEGGLSYVVFGAVFPTASKPGAAAGVGALAEVTAAVPLLPVLAVGGVTVETAGRLEAAGAAGFAAIGLFTAPEDRLREVVSGAIQAFHGSSRYT